MTNSFDTAAADYDKTFTDSVIGKMQRRYVYSHLSKLLDESRPEKILEVNCGTGEDAIWLSKKNFIITATDISEAMIAVAKAKGNFNNLEFRQADINEMASDFRGEKFDLILSNFGGLNCLSEIQLELFFKHTSELLSENGNLALVIMPKNTLWEQFYFLAKANFRKVNRRKKGSLIANVEGKNVLTFYYNPNEVKDLADYYYHFESVRPIGFFVPPSYLEPFLKTKKRLTSLLDKLEAKVQHRKRLSKYADHYLIVFRKR